MQTHILRQRGMSFYTKPLIYILMNKHRRDSIRNLSRVHAYLKAKPDAYNDEIAEALGMNANSVAVWAAAARRSLGIILPKGPKRSPRRRTWELLDLLMHRNTQERQLLRELASLISPPPERTSAFD